MTGIGEIFLEATLEPLIKQLGSEAFKFLTNHKRVEFSFDKLSRSLNLINGVLEDAEEKQYTEKSVKQWLAALRDAAYDLEDLLDEIQIQAEMEKRSRRKVIYKLFHIPRTLIFNHKMMSKIQDITRTFQDIWDQANAFILTSSRSGGSGYGNRKDVTSVPKPHMLEDGYVVGRDEKRKEIIKMLLKSKDDLLVLPIVGMGGIGKTTLAKFVYDDPKVKENFDIMAMSCVSTEFNKLEVTKSIYYQVTHKQPEFPNLDILQRELEKELVNKKFLIVLDEVWNANEQEWANLICPFNKGQPGSIIMVTTRDKQIAEDVSRNSEPVELKGLNDADCLSLMLHYAFPPHQKKFHHAAITTFDEMPEFKVVGMQLMKMCGGLPLAARALGGILVSKRKVEEWERVLNHKIWKLKEDNILPVLRLSYFDLPPHLKRMFAYCSIFPQDYRFKKTELVLLWMGEGFLDQHPNTQSKDDWGHECFDELVMKSFFQHSSLDESYEMHDLLNDLARYISQGTCYQWVMEFPLNHRLEKAHHCSFLTQRYGISNELKDFPQAKGLRTLLFIKGWYRLNKILPDLLPKLRHIRILSLRRCKFTELPDSICELTHLRYLDLSGSGIRTLPNSLDRLIWLETLLISGCKEISRLPKTLGNLCHLRHLDNSGTDLKYLPFEIRKLEHLQTLSEVVLSKEGGFGLKELLNLKNLGGSLTIAGLENVTSVQGVEECLKLKKNLHRLKLKWNMRNEFISDEYVLGCLRPAKELRELNIIGFYGSRFPSWVGDHSYTKLSFVSLDDCRNCTCLPPLGQLPNLKRVMIWGMDNITCIGDELYGHGGTSIPFSKLESLSLSSMRNLRKWCISGAGDGAVFSHLEELQIASCAQLEDVSPLFLESLRKLSIMNCSVVVLQSFHALSSLTFFEAGCISGLCHFPRELVQSFSSLEKLHIHECNELESLWQEDATLEHLTHLSIEKCDKLVSFPENGIPPSLKSLQLRDCNGLESLPSNITHVEELSVEKCNSLQYGGIKKNLPSCHLTDPSISLESLIQQISGFQSLVSLIVSHCDTIEELPSLPPNLKYLYISSCAALRSLPSDISFSSMESLGIWDCSQLDNFPSFVFPSKLSVLIVSDSGKLKPLNEWGLQGLLNLRYFSITGGFPELRRLNNTYLFPTSLNELAIEGFPMLVSLENVLENLNALQHLIIRKCQNLGKLPSERVLENLHAIYIMECPSLRIKYRKDLADYLKHKVGIPEVIYGIIPKPTINKKSKAPLQKGI